MKVEVVGVSAGVYVMKVEVVGVSDGLVYELDMVELSG